MNPFAPPETDVTAASPAALRGFSVEGRTLIVPRDGVLPPLCVFSGEPTTEPRVRKKLYWAPAWTAIFVISPLLYLIVYLLVRKTAHLDFAVGPVARRRRRQGLLAAGLGLPACVGLLLLGAELDAPLLLLVAPLAFLFVLIFAMIRARLTHVVRIDKEVVHLRLSQAAAAAFARAA